MDLIEQFQHAIEQMDLKGMDYEELHLSKEDCEYILKLLIKEIS